MLKTKIIFVDINESVCKSLREIGFRDVINDSFFSVKSDCIVSPCNSFGFMDGGLDYVISNEIGWNVQDEVKKRIKNEFNGELLVGQCMEHKIKHYWIKYLLVAPTMRVPMDIQKTANVYLSAKSIFNQIKKSSYKQVSISGLGCGNMDPENMSFQIEEAYKHVFINPKNYESWQEAQYHHNNIITIKA